MSNLKLLLQTKQLKGHFEMMSAKQQSLFPELYEDMVSLKPVNVASVPQRSPFRYPGGKTWFIPVFRNWIANHYPKPKILIEPFAGGAGFLKHGEKGKGIRSRWYPATLAKRFNNLSIVADRITFRQEDGLGVIREYSQRCDVVFFIDPPYTAGGKKAGNRLYRHFNLDHECLFTLCESLKGDFLMTYDNAEEVKTMARRHDFQMRLIPMTNTHHARMDELIIGKNLTWMDDYPALRESVAEYKVANRKKVPKPCT